MLHCGARDLDEGDCWVTGGGWRDAGETRAFAGTLPLESAEAAAFSLRAPVVSIVPPLLLTTAMAMAGVLFLLVG